MRDLNTTKRRARIAEMQNIIELTEVVNDAAETFYACVGAIFAVALVLLISYLI